MSSNLPPLPPGQRRNPAAASNNNVVLASSARGSGRAAGSSRQSDRSAAGSGRPLAAEENTNNSNTAAANIDEVGSRRSQGSRQSSMPQRAASSRASSGRAGASSTGRSITSSVALSKLQQLEDMLLEERRAREQAELTLLTMQREKLEREDKLDRGANAQKQLTEVMSALQRVLSEPHDAGGIARLRNIVRGAPPKSLPKEQRGSSNNAAPPAGRNQQAAANNDGDGADSTRSSQPRSFLDNIGSYDRDKQKNTHHGRKAAQFM